MNENFAENLYRLRKENGLTQEQLAGSSIFAKNGYVVSAFDIARSGLDKGRHLAVG